MFYSACFGRVLDHYWVANSLGTMCVEKVKPRIRCKVPETSPASAATFSSLYAWWSLEVSQDKNVHMLFTRAGGMAFYP